MKRILLLLAGTCALGGAVLTSGCGPGLVAAGGGSIGAIFGLQGDDKKKDDKPSTPGTNVSPAVVVTSLTREESPATITYTILDANNDLCAVEVQYSLNGSAFADCFEGSGGDGTTGLSSSAAGTVHTFEWDFVADLSPQLSLPITIRIRASDGVTTGSWSQLTNQSIGNDPPAFYNFAATGTDIILFSFDLGDQSSDLATLRVAYSIDQGQNFTDIDTDPLSPTYQLIGNPPVNMLATPGGSPGQFIWAAPSSLYDFQGDVILRVVPFDQPNGYSMPTEGAPVVTDPFPVDTSVNGPPVIGLLTATDGTTFTGTVPLDITLRDDESNSAVVIVSYSIGGSQFQPATLVNQFSAGIAGPFITNPSPSPYSVVWDALADVGTAGTFNDVVLVLTPADGTAGTPVVSDSFTVVGNSAPEVLDIVPLQDSGNIPVVVTMLDGQSDPVEVLVEYSTDGVNYTALTQTDFVFGTLTSLDSTPTGEANVLIWDTTGAFPNTNAAGVTLRILPTDHPPSATPGADLTGSAFVSAPFPIINNPNGAVPISIDIFTTTAGGAAHTPIQVTVTNPGQKYLDATINPSSAVGFTTFWKILETGADYGTLLDVGGGSLQYATGEITVGAPGAVVDGDTFVIDDGLNGPQTFEFESNGAITIGSIPVVITGFTTADEVGDALAAAINGNSLVRIDAVHTGGGAISLVHTIACLLGNAASVSAGGNAADMVFSGSAGTVTEQMGQVNAGAGTDRVLYQAPTTPPAGSQYVTLFCEIDDPAYFLSVRRSHTLWWGAAPTGVTITPPSPAVLVSTQQQFAATVTSAGGTAPQNVTWSVLGTGNSNGTITTGGLYTAPPVVPVTNPITVRATSVDGTVFGDATVTIQPNPTSITVNAPNPNPPNWQPPDLILGAAITFTATVSPSTAPNGVNWRVIWNSQDWGSGNSTVGTITAGGVYTAPSTLPSPDQVRIDAVSQVAPAIFGSYFVDLVAPPPTSFSVSPSSAIVFAGGAGQQFNATSFVPSNANTAVSWEINPVVGSISQAGFYTPPATSSTPQVITVTARSVVAPTITANASISLQPNAVTPPTGVVITPNGGLTISASGTVQTIQFTAQVNPGGASQNVNWTMQGTAFGNISSSGLYTPAVTGIDRIVTIRATAQASPSPFAEVQVRVCGDGTSWNEISNFTMGRGQVSTAWDDFNERLWFIGGTSETFLAQHDDTPIYVDFSGGVRTVGAYEAISKTTAFGKAPQAIMGVYDADNTRLLAVVTQGSNDPVEIYELDLTQVDPPTTPAEQWQPITAGSLTNAPKLSGLNSFHCWWDDNSDELQILSGNTTIYRFNTSSDSWSSPQTTQSQALAPADPQLVAHAYDTGSNEHYFIGATSSSPGASTKVWNIDRSDWKWESKNSNGSVPSGLNNPSAYFHTGLLHVFGGRPAAGSGYVDDIYRISTTGGSHTWVAVTTSNERPLPRGDAGFALAGFNGTYLYGGELAVAGTFGDLWNFDDSTGVFSPVNAINIRPQGRRGSTGDWGGGIGITYGGIVDHGVDNGTWTFTYNAGSGMPTWTRRTTTGTRPPALWGAASVWDPVSNRLILYGGDTSTVGFSGIANAYYSFDPATNVWTLLGTGPSKRREAAMCYDGVHLRIWMFGGVDDNGVKKNDLWYLNLSGGLPGSWVQAPISSGSPPDPRTGATIGFDTRSNRVLVCGGNSTVSGANSQLFTYGFSTGSWTPLSVGNTGSQEHVDQAAGVYDDDFTRIISTPGARKKTQSIVAATGGTIWHYMTPPPLANNSTGALGLYDRSTGRYYALFGERPIQSRNIGSNNLRTFVVK